MGTESEEILDNSFKLANSVEQSDLNIPDNWNKHIGTIWAQVLRTSGFGSHMNILEIAPGDVNKVGYGLRELNFAGGLYVLEPDVAACHSIVRQYDKCLPMATIVPLPATLKEAPREMLHDIDMIVSNHPLDDMIIGKSFEDKGFQEFFDGVGHRTARAEQVRRTWAKLVADPKRLEAIKQELFREWVSLVNYVKPKLLVIAQYESYFFRTNGITAPDEHAWDLMGRLRTHFDGRQNFKMDCPKEGYIEDPKRWLVVRPYQ